MSLILPITGRCDLNCLFCSSSGRRDRTSKTYLKKAVDQSCGALTITGGEPTLSPHLFWLIGKAKEKGLCVELQTNGVKLCSDELITRLARSKIDLLNVNFQSHIESVHDLLTQTKGLFNKKIDSLKKVHQTNINLRLTHVINSLSYTHLADLVLYARRNFPKLRYLQFSFIKMIGRARKNRQILISYENAMPYLLKALKICKETGLEFTVDHIPLCYIAPFRAHHADYRKISSGEIPEYSRKEKIKTEKCRKCSFDTECLGIRKDYLEFFEFKRLA